MLRLLGMAVVCLTLVAVRTTDAQEFPAPVVTVSMSSATPGGHPDQQTTFDVPTGPGFDQVRIVSPPGSSVAADADIPDGTIVGRLDAEATTNAITLPACTSHVVFTVPIRKERADETAASYPAYLRTLAPGPHRLRLVADVSPAPTIPILINYLFDVDPASKSLVTTVIIGDPTNPPQQFKSCTPQKSTNTLFGVTPAGTPLLTAPDPLPQPKIAFEFSFTSRPDANGKRDVQNVEAFASVAPTALPPLVEPTIPPPSVSIGAGEATVSSAQAAGGAALALPASGQAVRLVGPNTGSGASGRGGSATAGRLAAFGIAAAAAGLALRPRRR